MNYKMNLGAWNSVFAVPSDVVDKYILLASGPAVKVLLYLLRNSDKLVDTKTFVNALKLSEETVSDAITFWVQAGLLLENNGELCPNTNDMQTGVSFVAEVSSTAVNVTKVEKRKVGEFSPAEIAQRINGSSKIKALFSGAEKIIGKPLNHTDQRTLLTIHDYIGMHPDIILMLIRYSKSIDKCTMRYVQKVAESWMDEGINSQQAAEKKIASLKKVNKLASKIQTAFGIDRNLSAKECEYLDKWTFEYKMSSEMIEAAYQIMCNNGISKTSFAYIDKILASWDNDGIHTISKIPKSNTSKTKQTDTSYDLTDFEKQALLTTPKGKKND